MVEIDIYISCSFLTIEYRTLQLAGDNQRCGELADNNLTDFISRVVLSTKPTPHFVRYMIIDVKLNERIRYKSRSFTHINISKMHTVITDRSRHDKQPTPPSISTRVYIQWLPDPASEPTFTQVLTSSEKFFVDIRLLRPEKKKKIEQEADPEADPEETESEASSPATLAGTPNSPSKIARKIDWAFAGRSESWQNAETGQTQARWHHAIDSRFLSNPETVLDTAEMSPEDPRTGLTLEKGTMPNPATGKQTSYVEAWREPGVLHVPEASADFIESFERGLEERGVVLVDCDPHLERSRRCELAAPWLGQPVENWTPGNLVWRQSPDLAFCCVLEHDNVATQSCGMVVRLGQFCQGVLQVGDQFAAERWEWTVEFGWQKVFASGGLDMPCDIVCFLAEGRVHAGCEVRYGGGGDQVWQCLEDEYWKCVGGESGQYAGEQFVPVTVKEE